jgi:hypothetical protein
VLEREVDAKGVLFSVGMLSGSRMAETALAVPFASALMADLSSATTFIVELDSVVAEAALMATVSVRM